jgi:hypothetical protein
MAVDVEGVEELLFLLKQGGEKAVRGAYQQMVQEGTQIRDLARKMAPVDEGDLESAIKIRSVGGGRNSKGQFAKKEIEIYVDDAQPTSDGKGTVGEYAYIMHEHLAPYGVYKLGIRSQEKQLANPDVMVGGKFLERAVDEIGQGLLNRVIEAVTKGLNGEERGGDDLEE